MSGEDGGNGGIKLNEWLEDLQTPFRPYDGEIRTPVTVLDKAVLAVIDERGNENVNVSPADPYERTSKLVQPGVETLDEDGRLEFGEDYMIASFPLRPLGVAAVRCIYHKKFGRARIIVDDFIKSDGGGLASRTFFSSWESTPEVVTKQRETDFHSYLGQVGLGTFIDFSRELRPREIKALQAVLADTDILGDSPASSSEQAKTAAKFHRLIGESAAEAKLREKNRKEFDERVRKHREEMEAIARSHMYQHRRPRSRRIV